MDNLLTDHDDPEKRIAELEQSRSFVASAAAPTTKQMMKYTSGFMFAGMALLGTLQAAAALVGALLGSETVMQVGAGAALIAFFLLVFPSYAAFQRRMNREKKMLVCVTNDGLTVAAWPGDVFSLGHAQLGRWTLAGYGTTKGTALHLRCGKLRFVLGGQDHRIANATRLEAPPVDSVDAWMWAAEFDELLTMVGHPHGLDVSAPAPGEPTRCLLMPNPTRLFSPSFFGMFKNTATALSLNANPPQPSLAIDVGDDAISVIDSKSNARVASAPLAQVTATPAQSSRSNPYMATMTMPVLVVCVPDSQPLTIGCPDSAGPLRATWRGKTKLTYRFSWRGEVPSEHEPAYVVSDADWLTLAEKLGLAANLEDAAGAGAPPAGAWTAFRPARRRRTNLWIFALIAFFGIPPLIWIPASIVLDRHQQQADQVKADQERQFAVPFTDLRVPHGVAVDTAGNVYVADGRTNRVLKLAAGSNTQTVLPFTGLDLAAGVVNESTGSVAVDAAGNVYVTDTGHNKVLKLAAGSSTPTLLPFSGVDFPEGVAVDSAGTVYVADEHHYRVVKLAAGSSTQTVLPSMGRRVTPHNLAVDASGTVYASVDVSCGKRLCSYVMRLSPGSNTWTRLPSAGNEEYVAADNAGNVYVITLGDTGGVMMLAPGSSDWTVLPGAHRFIDPQGLAVDNHGYVYVTDHTGARQPDSLFGIWPSGSDNAQGFVLKLPTG